MIDLDDYFFSYFLRFLNQRSEPNSEVMEASRTDSTPLLARWANAEIRRWVLKAELGET